MAFALERTFPITKSCSALPQNLALINLPEQRVYHLGVIRKHAICVASFSPDDNDLANCKMVESGEKQSESEVIHQAKWLKVGPKTLFVMSSDRGFQVYEADGVSLMHSQSFTSEKKKNDLENVGARCAAAVGNNKLLIGRSDGSIMQYSLPNFSNGKGDIFTCGHSPIVEIAVSPDDQTVATCDDSGMVVIWTISPSGLQVLSKTRIANGWPCVGITFWRKWILVGALSGAVYVLDSADLTLVIEIFAHFRALYAMDVLNHSSTLGLLLTAGEDTYFRVFALRETAAETIEIEQCAAGIYPNQMICGARFLVSSETNLQDLRVALSSYESTNIAIYKCKLTA